MPISTTLLLVSSVNPSQFEQNILFTATVTGASSHVPGPTGTVQFFDGASPILTVPLVNLTGTTGQAQFQITTLTVGPHTITAVYSGDGNFLSSPSNAVAQVVTAVTSSSALFLPGFALTAVYSPLGDTDLPPTATLFSVPADANPHQSVTLVWDTLNVSYVRITGNNGVDYMTPPPPGSVLGFDTGFISTAGSGVYVVEAGFTATITLTLATYDATYAPLAPMSVTVVTVL
jgi:hypothetical protein